MLYIIVYITYFQNNEGDRQMYEVWCELLSFALSYPLLKSETSEIMRQNIPFYKLFQQEFVPPADNKQRCISAQTTH